MRILITGAHGFIGTRLRAALLLRQHEVIVPTSPQQRFTATSRAEDWRPVLHGLDAVVNTVGIFRERGAATFDAVHRHGPCVLWQACAQAGVARVLQVSALGADRQARTAFHRSKKAADDALLAWPHLDAVVVQPSLVFGADGASARLFLALATLPLLPLPAGGTQALQPVHVDDVVQAMVALLEAPPRRHAGQRIALVGPRASTLAAYLQDLRQVLQLPRAPVLALPAALVAVAARVGDHVPGALLGSDSWSMLVRGNVADATATAQLLGRAPRAAAAFVPPEWAAAARSEAMLVWQRWLLRLALAAVWIGTAVVSFGVFPVDESLRLLGRAGVPAAWRLPALYAAAALDLLLGVLTLLPQPARAARWLWRAQAALIVGYTLVITLRLPEYWLHPYGPLLKNLPMLALLWLLSASERRPPAGGAR